MTYGNLKSEVDNTPVLNIFKTIQNNISSGGDPIGDALRLINVAYWKMDETANTRLDSTSNDFDLILHADDPEMQQPVGAITGKISNAVQIFDSTVSLSNLINESVSIPLTSNALSITCWMKFDALTGGNISLNQNQSFDSVALFTAGYNDVLRGPVAFADLLNNVYLCAYEANSITPGSVLTPNIWYFCVANYDMDNGIVSLYVNNVLYWSESSIDYSSILNNAPLTIALVGSSNYINDGDDWIAVDELAIFTEQLTSDQINYLYNSGNGKELYP